MISQAIVILFAIDLVKSDCVHDQFAAEAPKHFYDDLTSGRFLQSTENGK